MPPPRNPPGRSSRRAPPPPEDREARERATRQAAFEQEEELPEDLGKMLFKLGRRLFAHRAHATHRMNDYRGEVQRRLLVRALNNDEERYQFLMERLERNRLRAKEYLTKAAALGLDGLSGWLEVQRGLFDAVMDRVQRQQSAEQRLSDVMDRLLHLEEEDVHQAALKSALLFEMVKDLLHDNDPLLQKLDARERQELFEYARGLRKDPPEPLARMFRGEPGLDRRGSKSSEVPPREEEVRVEQLDLGCLRARLTDPGPPDISGLLEPRFELISNAFEDKPLAFFIGPCVSVAPQGGTAWGDYSLGWPDARLRTAPIEIKPLDSGTEGENTDVLHDEDGLGLKSLGTARGTVVLRHALAWPWLHAHREHLTRQLESFLHTLSFSQPTPGQDSRWKDEKPHAPEELARRLTETLHYNADIHVKGLPLILRAKFQVQWA